MAAPRKTPRTDFNKTMTRELFRAINAFDTDIITALVDAGADIEARNEAGLTPLMLAADNRSDEAVSVLLQLGANKNAQSDTEKFTALHYAAKNSDTDTLKILLKAKADPNLKDHKGQTPLHHAAAEGDDDNVDLLVASGADVQSKDNMGRTAAKLAERKATDENHFMGERYHKIARDLTLKEIAAKRESDRKAAEDADRKAVQSDLEALRKNHDPSRFRLKPPPRK